MLNFKSHGLGNTMVTVAILMASAAIANANEHVSVADVLDQRFLLEVEVGAVWQSRNDVQIPNDNTGTRFSLMDLVGHGPWPTGRLYFTWNINRNHGLRALVAPFQYTETSTFVEPVNFAGQSYQTGVPVTATYKFNSFRLTYRYAFHRGERWRWWIGLTAKLRDAKIGLVQNSTASEDTDRGFVPLLHLAGTYHLSGRWRLLLDLDGLAGGPGRAFDVALRVVYEVCPKISLTAGYRTLEGGADVAEVYNFAWFNYAVVSFMYGF